MGRTNDKSIGLCEKSTIAYSSVYLLVAVRSMVHKSLGKEIGLRKNTSRIIGGSDKELRKILII